MLGRIIKQGIICGCRMEDNELFYCLSRVDGKPGEWMPAREAVAIQGQDSQSFAERYQHRPLCSLEFGRQAQAEI